MEVTGDRDGVGREGEDGGAGFLGELEAGFGVAGVAGEDVAQFADDGLGGGLLGHDHDERAVAGACVGSIGERTRAGPLAGHRIRIPGIVDGTEWVTFYSDLTAAFDLTIDALAPTSAKKHSWTSSPSLPIWAGERDRYLWPAHYDLRRIPLRGLTPIYPHSLLWLAATPQPALAELRAYLVTIRTTPTTTDIWTPAGAVH